MTDLPNSAADRAANASIPDGETPAGDPELAALVQRDAPPAGDPELAGLVRSDATPDIADVTAQTSEAGLDSRRCRSPEVGADATERVDTVPVLPLAAAVTDGEPRHGLDADGRSPSASASRSSWASCSPSASAPASCTHGASSTTAGSCPASASAARNSAGSPASRRRRRSRTPMGRSATGQITLTGPDGQTTTISYADVGRGPDTSALLDAALAAGRQGEPLANLIGGPQAAIHGVTLDSAVAYDRDKLAAAVETLATTIDQTPADASVSAGEGGTFSVSPAKDGRAVDKAALLTALDQQLAALGTPASITMAVPVVSLAPAVATASAEAAKAAADRMAADVVVTRGKDSWTIAGKSLAPLISFSTAADGTITPVFDESGLDPILKTLAKEVNQTAKDAGLKRVGGHIVATGTSREGRTLIADGMKAALISEIEARQAGAAASPVAAVVKAVDPKLTTADAKAFAPKMKVISSFSVFYWVIVNNHWGGNIEAPATKIDGTVVPPGGKFDFWKVVGDLRKLPGTGPGNAIEGGKITVTGAFGGGICTTSTTLFNAAFRAGMVPLARQNHNEYITRYPAGLDATVWIVGKTKQTMSFKNDTKYPILIQRIITHAGSKRWITFKIWSVPNHRTYKISNLSSSTARARGPRSCGIRPSRWGTGSSTTPRRTAPRWGSPCRSTTTASSTGEAVLLELPSGRRRHHRGDEEDLTPA